MSNYNDLLKRHLLNQIFGRQSTHSIAEALRLRLVPLEYVAEAIELVESFPYPRPPTWAVPARSLYNDPGWDNVVRALDEDR
jgi:hypothetical protein